MSFLKRASTNAAQPCLPAAQPDTTTATPSPKQPTLSAMLVAIAAAVICLPFGSHVLAKSGQQPEAKSETKEASNIDPDAVEAITKMGAICDSFTPRPRAA